MGDSGLSIAAFFFTATRLIDRIHTGRVTIAVGVNTNEKVGFLYLVVTKLKRIPLCSAELLHSNGECPCAENGFLHLCAVFTQITACGTNKDLAHYVCHIDGPAWIMWNYRANHTVD